MPVLINNYTTNEPTQALVAHVRYKIESELTSASTIFAFDQRAGLNHRIRKLLDEYSELEDNWDEDGAARPNQNSIQKAKFLTSLLEKHGQSIFHTAPGPNGEIMLDIRNSRKTKSLEIILYSNRSVVVYFPEAAPPVQNDFQIDQLSEHLKWVNSDK